MNLIHIAYAHTAAETDSARGIVDWFISLINSSLVPLIFALAFLLFLFGVFKYFFSLGSDAEESRQKGKQFILWAVIAFARSEEHTSELQSQFHLVCRLLLE